ncbi:MAG: hypothetical protein R8G66_19210 [Cytophagales bacterium]|nr:hypothetical protein [Cytophagales bacterium]
MIRLKAFLILLIASMLWLVACQTEEECEPPPCQPPMVFFDTFNFELRHVEDQLIEIIPEELEQISFKIDEYFMEDLTLVDNRLSTPLTWIDDFYDVRPITTYTLCTPYGADQQLTIITRDENEGIRCSCRNYFISHIIQNEIDTLFNGFYQEELISVSLN